MRQERHFSAPSWATGPVPGAAMGSMGPGASNIPDDLERLPHPDLIHSGAAAASTAVSASAAVATAIGASTSAALTSAAFPAVSYIPQHPYQPGSSRIRSPETKAPLEFPPLPGTSSHVALPNRDEPSTSYAWSTSRPMPHHPSNPVPVTWDGTVPLNRPALPPAVVQPHASTTFLIGSNNPAPPAPVSVLEAEPPRARMACTFCRVRKLRCDGSTPCRHCERRSQECIYAPSKGKGKATQASARPATVSTKAKDSPSSSLSSPPSSKTHAKDASTQLQATQQLAVLDSRAAPAPAPAPAPSSSSQSAGPSMHDWGRDVVAHRPTGTKRKVSEELLNVALELALRQQRAKHSRLSMDPDNGGQLPMILPRGNQSATSDLAMIQNDDTRIPMQPAYSATHGLWWDHVLSVIGTSRPFASRMVHLMLRRFVQSNAIFFGLLHAPTLIQTISSEESIRRADPSLYSAVLAVSAVDLHRNVSSEPLSADIRAADAASRKLAQTFGSMARAYIEMQVASETGLSPAVGQAASILALVQEEGSPEQNSLIKLAERVVKTLRLDKVVTDREVSSVDVDPNSSEYWRRPITSPSSEAEIKYESIVRLCWTSCSHRFRRLIALPDEEMQEDGLLPDYITEVRPMAFWEPSKLPADLPPSFFHSQDVMRRSARLSRLLHRLSQTEYTCHLDLPGRMGSAAPVVALEVLDGLDDLEAAFVRHRPNSAAELHSIVGRTLQMFCRAHVWGRMQLWRKHRLWSKRWSNGGSVGPMAGLSLTRLPPTVDMWLLLTAESAMGLEKDLDSFVTSGTIPQASAREIDSLIRHGITAMGLIDATGQRDKILRVADELILVLKRYLASAHDKPTFAQLDQLVFDRFQRLERLRAQYRDAMQAPSCAAAAAAASSLIKPAEISIVCSSTSSATSPSHCSSLGSSSHASRVDYDPPSPPESLTIFSTAQ